MDHAFLLKLALSFITGSLWITMGTVLAERHGTKIGGLVAGLPSTILISMFFIAWTQSTPVAVEATTVVPITAGINCIFSLVYVLLVRKNFWLALSSALAVWLLLSYCLFLARFNSFPLSLGIYFCLLIASHFLVEKGLHIKSEPGKTIAYTLPVFIYRGLFSGFVIALAVVMTKLGGPLLGGMFTLFPAMFIGTLFITYFSHGATFSAAVMKASILGAMSVVVFGVAVRYTYVPMGLVFGTLVSIIISFGSSILIHRFLARRTA
jgi:hypothetical protein